MAQVGDNLGRYRLIRRLSGGGMGEVFLGTPETAAGVPVPVAIKVIHSEYAQSVSFVQMMVDEAKITAHLRHQNIVSVIDFAEHEGTYYMAMEYVHGITVQRLLEWLSETGRKLEIALALHIAIEVSRALQYAHSCQSESGQPLHIVHRDVTPANVLLSLQGEVKLTDFGIARAQGRLTRTLTGAVKGKLGYFAPEMLRQEPFDARADLFSLGVMLYYLLAGQHPTQGDAIMDGISRFEEKRVAAPSTFNRAIPSELDALVMRALEPDPEQRWTSAGELRDALNRATFFDPQVRKVASRGVETLAALVLEVLPELKSCVPSLEPSSPGALSSESLPDYADYGEDSTASARTRAILDAHEDPEEDPTMGWDATVSSKTRPSLEALGDSASGPATSGSNLPQVRRMSLRPSESGVAAVRDPSEPRTDPEGETSKAWPRFGSQYAADPQDEMVTAGRVDALPPEASSLVRAEIPTPKSETPRAMPRFEPSASNPHMERDMRRPSSVSRESMTRSRPGSSAFRRPSSTRSSSRLERAPPEESARGRDEMTASRLPIGIALAAILVAGGVFLPSASSATLVIETIPPGATVTLNDVSHSSGTPLRITVRPEEAYKVLLTLDGYAPITQELLPMRPGETHTLTVPMARILPQVHIEPVPGRVRVNGQESATGAVVTLGALDLETPVHLSVEASGFKTFEQEWSRGALVPARITVRLEK